MPLFVKLMQWNVTQPATKTTTQSDELPMQVVPTHIYAQWFLDAPIAQGKFTSSGWQTFDTAVAHWQDSALPSENGNIVFYGHNVRTQLGNIRAFKGNERITITLSNGEVRHYKVAERVQTTGSDTSWIQPTDHEVLTLYTCDGLLDLDRFVVRAYPENPTASL